MDLKILATSDLHLGMRFSRYPGIKDDLSAARYQSLESLVEHADREGCGLFVVAGDLFDRLAVPQREIRQAAEILARFQGQALAVLPGNHDFLSGPSSPLWGGFREALEKAKADRILILDRAERVDLQGYGLPVSLYPAPCASKHGQESNVGWIRDSEDGRAAKAAGAFRIGLAHGSIEGLSPDSQGQYFPMRRSELEAAGLDLWIIGHTHRPYPEGEAGRTWLLVPGTPEPDGFDCLHDGGAWLLETSGSGQVRRRRVGAGRFRFRRETLELDDATAPAVALGPYENPEYERTLLRLDLRGRLSRERMEELRRLLPQLREHLAWVEVDESDLAEKITPTTIADEFPAGSFSFRLLKRLLEAEDADALQAAYDLLLEARR